MPTKAQVNSCMASDFEHFKGQNPRDFKSIQKLPTEFTGQTIGTISYDPNKKDLKITIDKNLGKEKDSEKY